MLGAIAILAILAFVSTLVFAGQAWQSAEQWAITAACILELCTTPGMMLALNVLFS
jgi:hypothetical protein